MRLSKKHIGQAFDVHGSDGSWFYVLLDASKTELLFYSYEAETYEIEPRRHTDWRLFLPKLHTKDDIKKGWQSGRRSPA